MMDERRAAVVVGVGASSGLGAALARRFAQEGLQVFIAGLTKGKLAAVEKEIRSTGGHAKAIVTDATVEKEVTELFNKVASAGFPLEIVAYNVGANVPAPLLETSTELFQTLWQQNCLGGFLVGREAIKHMVPQKRGTLLFTGATASLRARPPFTAFASAKASLRALAQSMAREFGPQGIHVIHAVIDGAIEGEQAKSRFPELVQQKGEAGLVKPEAIADTYWALHCQHPSAWTHEIDLRPFKEPF
ncbi:short-chain dehydrogenase/reductase SDR [Nitrosococcus halophilus Nc 4]|uniref:Short-chain dehydrogenase/reductase SDR n=1 Tax=Nitrosococcus halophilus (strain Nc4) TaxID=472759 RepID=D5BZ97_NITHN|nr:SDR family NAD(P)-dependent oxidoreductase [Nitrosococcus halophilus]ADE16111.1 short-chain dehydrogenase/reductase SDR [Nitrosococcus halophilus Nc 4]